MSGAIGIILAAGASSRMGRPKALLDVNGRPLIRHHIEGLLGVCERCVVVLGGHADQIRAVLPDTVEIRTNPDWRTSGPAESLLLALDTGVSRAIITPVDVPPAPRAVLEALLSVGGPAVPSWQGQDGHPVVVEAGARAVLTGGGFLRDALVGASRVDVRWSDTILNLNTPGQWSAWIDGRSQQEQR